MRCGYLEARGVTSASRTARDSLPPRPKPRQRHLVAHLVEHHLDRHPDPQLLVRAPDDVRVQADALLQLDDHDVVGHVLEEGGGLRAVDDDERVDRAASREPDPRTTLGEAARTEDARRPAEVAARRAALRAQLASAAALPVGRAVLGHRRERLLDDEHQPAPLARRARVSGAASTVRRKSATARLNCCGCSSMGRCPQRSSTARRACGSARRTRRLPESETSRSLRPQTSSVGWVSWASGWWPAAIEPTSERVMARAKPG